MPRYPTEIASMRSRWVKRSSCLQPSPARPRAPDPASSPRRRPSPEANRRSASALRSVTRAGARGSEWGKRASRCPRKRVAIEHPRAPRANEIASRACGLRFAEPDPLRQRQLAAPVDGGRLAAHVRLPRVGSGLSPAARFLLAAERAADFRTRSADVDVGDAAVAAQGRQERFGIAHAAREDRRRKPLWHTVLQRDRLGKLAIADHVENGREGLALHDRPLVACVHDDGRLDKEASAVPNGSTTGNLAAQSKG